MEIKSLENTCFGTLFEAFGQAFADYEVQLDETQLRRMLRRRGFDPRLSFAAFDGERIAAFTLNGRGNFNGLPTAYDTGTGTLEAYRGQGLAAKVFEHSIPYLREAGIRQYLLEVLQHNTKAVSVYRKLGFETAREFNYSIQQGAHVHLGAKIPDIACTVTPVDVGRFAPDPQFWDFMPSWQNSPEAIRRAAGDFAGLSARAEGTQVGYCIFEPASGDIALIAVDKRYRRRGIATSLLREALRLNKADSVKAINTEAGCESLTAFLEAANIAVTDKALRTGRALFMYTRAVCLLLHDADREDQIAGTDVVDDVQPLDHPAEAGVAAVEVLRRLAGAADKKLRAARVLSGMGHREHAPVVILARRRGLAFDLVPGAARAVAPRAAALDDEARNHPVEGQPVVEIVVGQLDEVRHRTGGLLRIELGLHVAFLGRNKCVLCHIETGF